MKSECILLFTFLFLGGFFPATQSDAEGLKVLYEGHEKGLSQMKAEAVLKGSPEEVWAVIYPSQKYSQFMPRVLASAYVSDKVLEAIRKSGTNNANKIRTVALRYAVDPVRKPGAVWEGLFFVVIDTPFPVANRWHLLRVTHDETKASQKIFKRCWTLVTGNMKRVDGCWNLRPTSHEGETDATYSEKVDPGGHLPQWVLETGATVTIPQVFKAVQKRVQGAPPL